MAAIKPETRTVYLAPSKGRRYLSVRSAAAAEARAMLDEKHPAQRAEFDGEGRCTDGGWHWSSDPFLLRVHKRLARLILARARKSDSTRQPASPPADWMTCESRSPWAINSLKQRADEMRQAGKRCRNAYRKDYMGVMARYVADAFDEAACAFERRLSAIEAARQPTQKDEACPSTS